MWWMVGGIVCCRLPVLPTFDGNIDSHHLQQTGGVAIAGALQHLPSLTVLEYVVGSDGVWMDGDWAGNQQRMSREQGSRPGL
jgi:hypothetical protein